VIFSAACSVGVLINLSFAHRLFAAGLPWYLAGLSGVAISSFWNYGVNTIVTWRRTRGFYESAPAATPAAAELVTTNAA
jgi:putative flippase GtrA